MVLLVMVGYATEPIVELEKVWSSAGQNEEPLYFISIGSNEWLGKSCVSVLLSAMVDEVWGTASCWGSMSFESVFC